MSMTYGPNPVASIAAAEENDELTAEELRQLRALRVLGGQWSSPYSATATSTGRVARLPKNDVNDALASAGSASEREHGTGHVSFHTGSEQLHRQHLAAESLTSHQIQSELATNAPVSGQAAGYANVAAAMSIYAGSKSGSAPEPAERDYQQVQTEMQTGVPVSGGPYLFAVATMTPIAGYAPVHPGEGSKGKSRVARVAAIPSLEQQTIEAQA